MHQIAPRLILAASLCLLVSAPVASAQGGQIPPVPVPAGNQMTQPKMMLGKALFWDEQLSSTRTVSCGTCHIPAVGGSDPRAGLNPGFDQVFGTGDDITGSPGVILSDALGKYFASGDFGIDVQVTGRKAPTMINAAFAPVLFWDGRATNTFSDPVTGNTLLPNNAALESQAVGPLLSDVEMAHMGRDWDEVVARVEVSVPLAMASNLSPGLSGFIGASSYPDLFAEAFGSSAVTPARIGMALATYERSLVSNQAPIDLGGGPGPGGGGGNLTLLENQGRQLFNNKGRCGVCHSGPLFTDFAFKNTGVTPIFQDLGRGAITGVPGQNGQFKTPGLRNIELSAPYFHNGSAQTLEEVVDFYDRGGDFHNNQAPAVAPIGFTPQEKVALVAFLKRPLTDPRVANETGPFRRPTLYSESNLQPSHYGFGSPAPSGIVPRAIAVEPPMNGNPSMTVAITDAPPVGNGLLVLDFAQGFSNVLGADVLLALSPNMIVQFAGPMNGSGQGGGYNSVSIDVPSGANLVGIEVFMQWFVVSGNLAATEGIRTTIF